MMKYQVSSRTFYSENPLTAGHPVKGTQVSILSIERDGACLVGDSPIEWDEAAKKNIAPAVFEHYEKRNCSEQEAVEIVKGKVAKLISDGYIFEVSPDMEHFVQTGQLVYEVYKHPPVKK
jgi:hypothetical protein